MRTLIHDGAVLPFDLGKLIERTYSNKELLKHQQLSSVGLNGYFINELVFSVEMYDKFIAADDGADGRYEQRERIYGYGDPIKLKNLKDAIKSELDQSSNE